VAETDIAIQKTPAWFLERDEPSSATGQLRTVSGKLMTTPERAKQDARKQLDRAVQKWLSDAGVPASWSPPRRMVDGLILDSHVQPDARPDFTVYQAAYRVDFSPRRRDQIFQVYDREVVGRRLALGIGGLAFVLVSLAGLAGYIRADEATRGYYTNRLRLAAAAGVGAAGVALYKLLT